GSVIARSTAGEREIGADEFFVGHFTTALRADELVVATVWPSHGAGWGFAFEELAHRHGDYGLGMAACALRVEGGRVAEARVGVGSVVDRPMLLPAELSGRAVTPEGAGELRERVGK